MNQSWGRWGGVLAVGLLWAAGCGAPQMYDDQGRRMEAPAEEVKRDPTREAQLRRDFDRLIQYFVAGDPSGVWTLLSKQYKSDIGARDASDLAREFSARQEAIVFEASNTKLLDIRIDGDLATIGAKRSDGKKWLAELIYEDERWKFHRDWWRPRF